MRAGIRDCRMWGLRADRRNEGLWLRMLDALEYARQQNGPLAVHDTATVDRATRELLGGDLLSGGRLFGPPDSAHLLYCVYVAKDVSGLDSHAGQVQQRSSH